QRFDTLGATGNEVIQTPHLDALARDGVLFEQSFCTTSICAVSRASLLTGQYARRHGIWDFSTSLTSEAFAQTFPALLRKHAHRPGRSQQGQLGFFDGLDGGSVRAVVSGAAPQARLPDRLRGQRGRRQRATARRIRLFRWVRRPGPLLREGQRLRNANTPDAPPRRLGAQVPRILLARSALLPTGLLQSAALPGRRRVAVSERPCAA